MTVVYSISVSSVCDRRFISSFFQCFLYSRRCLVTTKTFRDFFISGEDTLGNFSAIYVATKLREKLQDKFSSRTALLVFLSQYRNWYLLCIYLFKYRMLAREGAPSVVSFSAEVAKRNVLHCQTSRRSQNLIKHWM